MISGQLPPTVSHLTIKVDTRFDNDGVRERRIKGWTWSDMWRSMRERRLTLARVDVVLMGGDTRSVPRWTANMEAAVRTGLPESAAVKTGKSIDRAFAKSRARIVSS